MYKIIFFFLMVAVSGSAQTIPLIRLINDKAAWYNSATDKWVHVNFSNDQSTGYLDTKNLSDHITTPISFDSNVKSTVPLNAIISYSMGTDYSRWFIENKRDLGNFESVSIGKLPSVINEYSAINGQSLSSAYAGSISNFNSEIAWTKTSTEVKTIIGNNTEINDYGLFIDNNGGLKNIENGSNAKLALNILGYSDKNDRSSKEVFTQNIRPVSSEIDWTKASSTDYAVLPKGKPGSIFEFHDHEVTTINGTVTGLSTIYMSSIYSTSLPAEKNNGTEIIQNSIYQVSTFGSGKIPWKVETAPSLVSDVSIAINTFSNLMPQNNRGYFVVNAANGNSFKIGTDDDGGVISLTNSVGSKTNLTILTSTVYTTGQIISSGVINSNLGLIAGDIRSGNVVRINPNAMTMVSGNNFAYVGIGNSWTSGSNYTQALVVESKSRDGIVINSNSDYNKQGGNISLSIDRNNMVNITSMGLTVGGGQPEPSAIASFNSKNQAVLFPRLTDYDLYAVEKPVAGIYAYSVEHNSITFFNGDSWVYIPDRFLKKIKRPKQKLDNSSSSPATKLD